MHLLYETSSYLIIIICIVWKEVVNFTSFAKRLWPTFTLLYIGTLNHRVFDTVGTRETYVYYNLYSAWLAKTDK